MTTSRDTPSAGTESPHPPQVSAADLEDMSQVERARLAARLDDVEVVRNERPWPVPGTRAERRAERSVLFWLALSALSALAFLLVFLLLPHEYRDPGEPGRTAYLLSTPLTGGTLGLAVLALGVAVITYVRKFFPDEVAVQQRHDGPSDEVARQTVLAQVLEAGEDTGLGRRRLIQRGGAAAAGLLGLGLGVAAVAPLVRDPWAGGPDAALWHTPWRPVGGEPVFLRYDTGDPAEVVLVRPEDQAPGSLMTVFPFRESERHDEEALLRGLRATDAPVMLLRLHPGTATVSRPGQEGFHFGDYYAYSKICTHLGCPASLFESDTNRILCPCHQSQFLATESARPIFGPAARPLPQLPITVNADGYFVATGDFPEPIGPSFWERRGGSWAR